MSKKLMVIWGMIVVIICLSLLLIGFYKKDKVLWRLEKDLKQSSKKYITDKKIEIKFNESYVLNIDELINENYIKDVENIKKYCINGVIISNNLLYEYTIKKDCDNNEIINQ